MTWKKVRSTPRDSAGIGPFFPPRVAARRGQDCPAAQLPRRGARKKGLCCWASSFLWHVCSLGGAEGRDEMKSEIPSAHGTATTCRGREKRALPKGVEGGGTFLDNAKSQPIGFFHIFNCLFFYFQLGNERVACLFHPAAALFLLDLGCRRPSSFHTCAPQATSEISSQASTVVVLRLFPLLRASSNFP